jgi:ribosomal protein S30
MIPLREHNDIVEKLMKELENKDQEMKNMTKEKKTPSQGPQLQPTSNEQALNRKINQLNKEYKERVNGLTQQLRNKSV